MLYPAAQQATLLAHIFSPVVFRMLDEADSHTVRILDEDLTSDRSWRDLAKRFASLALELGYRCIKIVDVCANGIEPCLKMR